jgi:ribosomal protein S18 acetylase RimI-like enzyme
LAKRTDIASIYELCKIEHWNYSLKMIERLIAYEPNGCFVAEVKGGFAGQVFSIDYGTVGWIGVLIVNESHRRKGIGSLLMKQAMRHLLNSDTETIRLEAVPEIAHLYHKLGFVDEFYSLRFLGDSRRKKLPVRVSIRRMSEDEIFRIAGFDKKYFGGDRTRVLRRLYQDSPELCFFSQKASKINGYIISYEMENGYRIGPWVCNPRSMNAQLVAQSLLLTCMNNIENNTKLYVGVPEVSNIAISLLHYLDFKMVSKSIHMYFGKRPQKRPAGILSISGPENG